MLVSIDFNTLISEHCRTRLVKNFKHSVINDHDVMSSCDLGQLLGPFGSLRLENWCAHKITMIYKQRKNRETRSRNLSVFQKLGYILIDCRRYTEEHITVGLFPGDSWWACLLQSGHTWLPFESKLKSFRPSGAQLRILPQTQVSSCLRLHLNAPIPLRILKFCLP